MEAEVQTDPMEEMVRERIVKMPVLKVVEVPVEVEV
jgi:hypothetical protein